jgi:molybdopterin-guanine dinucleotide biosynthesis protein A
VLACDVPRIADAVAALLDAVPFDAALPEPGSLADGYVAVDDDGRRQPLLALYRIDSLRERLGAIDPVGASMRLLLDGLDLTDVPVRSTVTADVDTADDARRFGIDPGSAG